MIKLSRCVPAMRTATIDKETVIKMKIKNVSKSISRQKGAVTVFVALILMIAMTMMALTAGKYAYVEQETAGADYRTQEAAEATSAGLEWAMAWLDDDNACVNCVSGTPLDIEGASVANVTMPNIVYDKGDQDAATGTGYEYNPTVTLTRGNNFALGFTLVQSTLGAVGGNTESGVTITGSEQVYITQWNQLLTPAGSNAPPIIVNGCLVNTTGNPTVYPTPAGPAILTVETAIPVDWNDPNAPTGYCLDPGHLDVELCNGNTCGVGESGDPVTGSDLDDMLVGIDLTLNPHPQAWNYLFEISLPAAKQMAAEAGQTTDNKNDVVELQPTNADYVPFIHYTGKNPINSATFGTPMYPVVIIMSHEDCPQFNGGATIYGILYYEDPLDKCNGMGGATVIGSGVFEGDATKLNANTEFYPGGNLTGANIGGPLFTENAARIPGTWRDW